VHRSVYPSPTREPGHLANRKKLQGRSGSARRWFGDADGFRLLRRLHGLTIVRCAALLGVTARTVSTWESGRVRVPYAPYRLLRVLLGAELPGRGWEGFRLAGDRLVTPEGHEFARRDFEWWSLTCRRAEAFASVFEQLSQQIARASGRVASIGDAANDAPSAQNLERA